RLHCASILHFSKYVFIATLSSRTVHSLDKVIISQFVGPAGVGVYSIAQNLAQKLWLPVGSITFAVLPAASAVSDRARLGELYLRSSKMVVAITLFPAFALCLFRYEMLLYWLGPAFASAADATLGILSAACFLHALAHVPYVVAQAKGHPAITAAFAGVTAGLYLVLLVSLAQAFGIVGAAVSFLAVQTIVTPLFVYAVNRRLEISSTSLLRRAYLPAIAASVATVCFSLMTKPLVSSLFSLLLVLALDAVFHLMICTLVVLDRSERRAFWVYFRAPSDLQRSRVPRYSRP
ncbi:MAG: lipopolysaccharide biosynthesis protein, partial [Acidimicrobiia bacterium]